MIFSVFIVCCPNMFPVTSGLEDLEGEVIFPWMLYELTKKYYLKVFFPQQRITLTFLLYILYLKSKLDCVQKVNYMSMSYFNTHVLISRWFVFTLHNISNCYWFS